MRITARISHCCVCVCWIAAVLVLHTGLLAVNTHKLGMFVGVYTCVCVCVFMHAFLPVSFLLRRFILFPLMQWLILCSEAALECVVMSESFCRVVMFLFVPSLLLGISFCTQNEGLRPPLPVTQTHYDWLGNAAQLLLLCLCLWLSHLHDLNECVCSAKWIEYAPSKRCV